MNDIWNFKNWHVENIWHSYLMQPGDGTLYRFGFCKYPVSQRDSYTLDSGVGCEAYKEYIKFYIQMTATGLSVCRIHDILHFPEQGMHILGYLQDHGLENCNTYTLIAVLLALKVLWIDPTDVDRAAQFMLDAEKIIKRI